MSLFLTSACADEVRFAQDVLTICGSGFTPPIVAMVNSQQCVNAKVIVITQQAAFPGCIAAMTCTLPPVR